jgi:hypothetical protein
MAAMHKSAPYHCCRVLLRGLLFLSCVGQQQVLPEFSTHPHMPSLCLAVLARERTRHHGHGHHCRQRKLHRCSLSFAAAAPSHDVHVPRRCRATARPRLSRSSTDAPIRWSHHQATAGAHAQGATTSLRSGRGAPGVHRHARMVALLPLAAGAAPTASASLPCSLL